MYDLQLPSFFLLVSHFYVNWDPSWITLMTYLYEIKVNRRWVKKIQPYDVSSFEYRFFSESKKPLEWYRSFRSRYIGLLLLLLLALFDTCRTYCKDAFLPWDFLCNSLGHGNAFTSRNALLWLRSREYSKNLWASNSTECLTFANFALFHWCQYLP